MKNFVIDWGIPIVAGMINAQGSWLIAVYLYDRAPPPEGATFGLMVLGCGIFAVVYTPVSRFLRGPQK